jgi:hypothetical protein
MKTDCGISIRKAGALLLARRSDGRYAEQGFTRRSDGRYAEQGFTRRSDGRYTEQGMKTDCGISIRKAGALLLARRSDGRYAEQGPSSA